MRSVDEVKAIPGQGMSGFLDRQAIFLGAPRFARERAAFSAEADADVDRLERQGKTVTALVSDDRLVGLVALRDKAVRGGGRCRCPSRIAKAAAGEPGRRLSWSRPHFEEEAGALGPDTRWADTWSGWLGWRVP